MFTVHDLRKAGFSVKVRHNRKFTNVQKLDGVAQIVNVKGGSTEVGVYFNNELVGEGFARCSKRDNYNRKLGVRIALGRAMKNIPNNAIANLRVGV